jgi:hypothetical protein
MRINYRQRSGIETTKEFAMIKTEGLKGQKHLRQRKINRTTDFTQVPHHIIKPK